MTTETNSDGLKIVYGAPEAIQGGGIPSKGLRKELKVTVDFDDLPNAGAKGDDDIFVPAGAIVESCKLVTGTAFAGGTTVTIGFYNKAGTAIDADGIDATIATAALTGNTVIVNDGALSTNKHVGTVDAYVGATAAGTYTAGSADLIITYFQV